MEYTEQVQALTAEYPALARELRPLRTLEGVLAWMRGHGQPLSEMEIVFQDEYSHDVLLPLGRAGEFLVLGIT